MLALAVTRFAEWFEGERKRRGVNRSTVAYLIGTTPSTLAAWVNEGRRPDTDSLRALAAAWHLPEEDLLRLAGHLSAKDEAPKPESVPGWLVTVFEPLTPHERDVVAKIAEQTARGLLQLRGDRSSSGSQLPPDEMAPEPAARPEDPGQPPRRGRRQ